MSRIHLYLTRHGRTHWNELGRFQGHTDVPLDAVGRAQARALAQTLVGRIDAVITSDLLRASETAQIVAHALSLAPPTLDADLRERGYGVFEGLTPEECAARFPEHWAERLRVRDHEPPGGEPRAQVVARMQRALERAVVMLRAAGRAHALVVSHGSCLRMFIETLSRQPVISIANLESREVVHGADGFQLVELSSV
jgi:broad specificity phosphatase PhoE